MSADVLGARVHRDVRAQLERALEYGRAPRVVDGAHSAAGARDRCDGGNVDDAKQRIRWRLDPDELRVRPHRVGDGVEIRHVDERELDPPWSEHVAGEL